MNLQEFETLVSDIVSEKITLFLLTNQDAKKWYEQKFERATTLENDTIYGVLRDRGGTIDFMFKTGKNEDTLLKTFITQYTTKVKEYDVIDGEMVELKKQQKLEKLIRANQDRVHKGLFYTTLYGIGLWDFFNSKMTHNLLHKEMDSFLNSNGIKYQNEYSDAMWVWRYKFNTHIKETNELLNKFKIS